MSELRPDEWSRLAATYYVEFPRGRTVGPASPFIGLALSRGKDLVGPFPEANLTQGGTLIC